MVKSQLVVLFSVLVAFAAILLALLSSGGQSLDSDSKAGVNRQSAVPQENASTRDRNTSRAPTERRSIPQGVQPVAVQPTSAFLQTLGTALNASAEASLQLETDVRFAEFFSHLLGSPERIDAIRQQLISAYGDILAFGVALQQGAISPAEAALRSDPNYVVNQLAELLTAEELTDLETFMETDARQRFRSTYSPQLELIGVELNGDNKDKLLETLFTETYLLVNNDGLGMAANLESGFQRQLDAIANTRDSLRLSMTSEQFQQADAFLSEQEQGLLGAQTIFSPR